MKPTITKFILPWITVIALFVFGYYLSADDKQPSTELVTSTPNSASNTSIIEDKDYFLKQKLLNDFENAFLKQYTPIIGCEVIDENSRSAECNQHLEHSKNEFKQQFIKNRGLPKNTFEELKLSFVE